MEKTWEGRMKNGDHWKKVIQSNMFDLCQSIDRLDEVLDILGVAVFTKRTREEIMVKKGKYKQNNCMLTALLKKSYADFNQLCNALLQTKQGHIISQFLTQETAASELPPKLRTSISEGGIHRTISDAVPADDSWKLLIQSRMCLLMEKIDPDNGLIPQLVQKDLIPVWISDTFSEEVHSVGQCRRVEKILKHVMQRSYADYEKFCTCLEDSNQAHIVTELLNPHIDPKIRCSSAEVIRTCSDVCMEQLAPVGWKKLLVENSLNLKDDIDNLDEVISELLKNGVLNRYSAEKCKELKTSFSRVDYLLDHLSRRPDRDFIYFCNALKATNQAHIVTSYLTVPERTVQPIQESTAKPVIQRKPNRVFQPASCSIAPGIVNLIEDREIDLRSFESSLESSLESSHESSQESSRESGFHSSTSGQFSTSEQDADPFEEDESGQHSNSSGSPNHVPDERRSTPIGRVYVHPCTQEFYQSKCNKAYPMNQHNRGRCLVFNNKTFYQSSYRTGTEEDSRLLRNLFSQLFFKVEEFNDLTVDEMKEKMEVIARDGSLQECQCLAVFILSHGGLVEGKTVIVDKIGNSVALEDLRAPFNDQNCRSLRQKPKLFFVQACRGDAFDQNLTEFDGVATTESDAGLALNSFPDFLVCFPTQFGYRAFRDQVAGSWFVNAITRTFMEHAHNTGVCSMMNMVSGLASKWLSTTGDMSTSNKTQFAEYSCSFTKPDLYFFPGVYTPANES